MNAHCTVSVYDVRKSFASTTIKDLSLSIICASFATRESRELNRGGEGQ